MIMANDAGRESNCATGKYQGHEVSQIHSAMIQASPGTALLAEVLAARDALPGDPESWSKRLGRLLAALDKLGPAAEGVT